MNRVLVVSRHDVEHPLAGEIERYLHQITLRWAAWGTRVTWLTTRTDAMPAAEVVDGVEVRRAAGAAGIYRRLAGGRFDAVVDALGLALVGRTPVVRVAHARSTPDRKRAGRQPVVALSTTAAHELRRRHRLQGPIFVVPPGATAQPRAANTCVAVVAPPAEHVLRAVAERLGVAVIDGHGGAVLDAAARGVPCVGVATQGIRDFVRDGRTGWLVDSTEELGAALAQARARLADDGYARQVAEQCQAWAGLFRWERSARLLAGVVAGRLGRQRERRQARQDIATVARFPAGAVADPAALLRSTDEVSVEDGVVSVLLRGCDESDAAGVLARLGVPDAWLQLADKDDLLLGPQGALTPRG